MNHESPDPDNDDSAEQANGRAPKVPLADKLIAFATEWFEPFRAPDGRLYGVRKDDPTRALRHGKPSQLVAEIKRLYHLSTQRWPSGEAAAALADYLDVYADEVRPVPIRSHWDGSRLLVDVGNPSGDIVSVSSEGVCLAERPGVCFRKSPNTAELGDVLGVAGDLDELWRLTPVAEPDRPIVLALLITAWLTGVPQPVVLVTGPQDSGKTTTARYLLSLVDPVTNQRGGSLPVREDEWKARVAQARVVFVDNTSHITPTVADLLCRVATGGEMTTRTLYTDDGAHVSDLLIPVWLTSIDTGVLRGDLQSRIVPIELEAIGSHNRRVLADLQLEQDASRAVVTRGLLDLAAHVMRILPTVDRSRLEHRMTEFALILRCVDQILGTEGAKRLVATSTDLAGDVLDADPVALAIMRRVWVGADGAGVNALATPVTIATLLKDLTETTPIDQRGTHWPATPTVLSSRIKRLAPSLEQSRGVSLHVKRTKHAAMVWAEISGVGS